MYKDIYYGEEAREKLKAGVDKVAKAVLTTLGPKGRNVGISRPYGDRTHVVHDGVTVARSVELQDLAENEGAKMVKEASSRTNDVAGDGTTTSMVIAQAIVDEGLKNITAGANPMQIKAGIEDASIFVNNWLKKNSKKIKEQEQIEQVAIISSANNELGKLVAEAIDNVGREGTVVAEETQSFETEVEYKEGMELDTGFLSPHFVTDMNRGEAVIKDCLVLITDRELDSPYEIKDFLDVIANPKGEIKNNRILIIAKNMDQGGLATLVVNHVNGVIKAIAIPIPRGSKYEGDFLHDIAALVDGKVMSQDTGDELNNVQRSELGFAKRVVVTKDSTIIQADKGPGVEERLEYLRQQMKDANSPLEAERFEERIAKLQGGIAVISVGAASEVEAKEKLERVKDAIGATKAALDEGILPGGGVALVSASQALREYFEEANDSIPKEERLGAEIVAMALEQPLWHIVNNAGKKADAVVEQVKDMNGQNIGYEVINDTIGDMIALGIIDPVKVTRHAVIHGCSVAGMIISTECLIIEQEEKKNEETE